MISPRRRTLGKEKGLGGISEKSFKSKSQGTRKGKKKEEGEAIKEN